ncbi:unannotated protein [freshwater metagenome]|uniref:Unannotated protein n=1 Tax=freshwater metagenome TaxID=449393 RepID=A0A6J6PC86_9ZZZZ
MALAIAMLLAVFLLYTAVVGNSTPVLQPSNLAGHTGTVSLTGEVIGPVAGESHTTGLTFGLRDISGKSQTIPINFHGSVPDLFKVGRHVNLTGAMKNGTFVATDMTTKCPSKYTTTNGS